MEQSELTASKTQRTTIHEVKTSTQFGPRYDYSSSGGGHGPIMIIETSLECVQDTPVQIMITAPLGGWSRFSLDVNEIQELIKLLQEVVNV